MKAYSIPTLPLIVEKYYSNVFVRLFRVIGGISVIMVLTKFYLNLPEYLHLFFTIFASIQVTLVMIIFIIKFCYGIYTLIYKKEIFEVRNSPLNRYATIIGKALYCIKISCAATGACATLIVRGVAYDSLLVETGREKLFLPLMDKTYNGFFGAGPIKKVKEYMDNTGK